MRGKKRTHAPVWHKEVVPHGPGRNKTRARAREYKVYCREMAINGMVTDSNGQWHQAKSLDGRNGCSKSAIRNFQAGYKIPKHELYT